MNKLLILLLILSLQINAQEVISEHEKATSLIRVWGLMKYQHPEVSEGEYDWNQEFIDQIESLQQVNTQQELNNKLLDFLYRFDMSFPDSESQLKIQAFKENSDYTWIQESHFSPELENALTRISKNTKVGDHYASVASLTSHLKFENEEALPDFNPELKSHRLLFLSGFWNAMNYWNVNLYLTDQPWSEVLKDMSLKFIEADTKTEFELVRLNLFSAVNDSHSNFLSDHLFDHLLKFHAPFGGRLVNDSLVVTKIYDSALTKKAGIKLGDVISKIENKPVSEYLEGFSKLVSASNKNYLKSWAEDQFILSKHVDVIEVELVTQNNKKSKLKIQLFPMSRVSRFSTDEELPVFFNDKDSNWKILDTNIAYLNLGKTTKREIKQMFKSIGDTKGLIIDLRNYPRQISEADLTKYLYPNKAIFIKVLMPYAPSIGEYDGQSGMKFFKNPFASGSKNTNYYDKKIVLMVDRNTGSKAEFIGMAIQNSPNCISIGEQTMGAVMNVIEYPLIDRTMFRFTGMGAFYPSDNTGVQRKGLKIDHIIKESALGYDYKTYLEEAVKIIEQPAALGVDL